jgi:hypothetical protein
MIGKLRRLALALTRGGPFGGLGLALAEADDAAVLEALTRSRPLFPRILDRPPAASERPFQSLADLARAAAAVEAAAAAQAMLRGLGVEPRHLAPDGPLLAGTGADAAALDVGLVARTLLVKRLLTPAVGKRPAIATDVAALDARDVRAFEAQLRRGRGGSAKLPAALEKRARALLQTAAPAALGGAATAVADRWIAGLAPLEPVLVRTPPPRPRKPPATKRPRPRSAPRRPRNPRRR